MITTSKFELPEQLAPVFRKAKRLEWITLCYLLSVTVVMYLAMGNSQAMKVAWIEDVLSIIPSVSFLVAAHFFQRAPNKKFPYGYHRTFTIAFLCGSVALFGLGAFLLVDSTITLIKGEHPSIGAVKFGDHIFWLGYLMYAALAYSSVPAMILGKKKLPLSRELHNKILYTDADTQKADWMTAMAAVAGVTGIGWGLWWTDPVAAIFISFNVLHDGYNNLRNAVRDLIERKPYTTDLKKADPLLQQIDEHLKQHKWIRKSAYRFRENGQVYFGEIFIVPRSEEGLVQRVEELVKNIRSLHWKIHDVTVMPVKELPEGNNVSEEEQDNS